MNKLIVMLIAALGLFTACAEKEAASEFDNWEARNTAAFVDTLRLANAEIAKAKAQYGAAWADHCNWRTYRSYTNIDVANTTWKDSIAVRIHQRGTGSGTPLYTDTVRVAYIGRLLPTDLHPEGYVFDKTGTSAQWDRVFSPQYMQTNQFAVSNLVEGFTTALQQMHIGDRWRVFMPADMGYGATTKGSIPAYSMLIFDMQLTQYWRAGSRGK